MPDIYVGQVATFGFQVVNAGVPITGLISTDFTWNLNRRTGANVYAAAPEAVSLAERGSGWYEASFTVAAGSDGYFYVLSVLETAITTAGIRHDFFVVAGSEAEAFTEADAYCSLSDVTARVGRGPFSEATVPTEGQVVDFMALRAAQITASLADAGKTASPSSGSAPISTTSDAGKSLERLCRAANAAMAAGDAMYAFDVTNTEDPARARAMWAQGSELLVAATAMAREASAVSAAYPSTCDETLLPFQADTRF